MRNNGVIIATNAEFLAGILREKFMAIGLQVFIAASDNDLTEKINSGYSKFIFIEHCFHGYGTDVFIHRMVKRTRNMRVVVWAACEVKPVVAARYIEAGAESFLSLRDTESNIETVIKKTAWGQRYRPADVEAVLDKEGEEPLFDKDLTKREIEIMKMSVTGKTNEQIGNVFSISVNTVKMHKKSIYRKCGGNTALDILRNGLIKGVLSVDDLIQ
jgi:DNA-binding CsgD family transcriptional regulator